MLRSSLCDYSEAYILVKCTITVTGNHPRDITRDITFRV